jgi:glucose/arabinose dehydrogenase
MLDSGRLRRLRVALGASAAVLLAACGTAGTTTRAGSLRLVKIGTFVQPLFVTGAPGDNSRLFVVQKQGSIAVVVHGHRAARPFLDITHSVNSSGNEQGLLSMAFAPDYQKSGRFYVDYTGANGDIHVVEFRRSAHSANLANASSARTVIVVAHHDADNHNGGQLQFGPDDDLYIGIGDGGSEDDPHNYGQNTHVLVGKLLRVAPKPNGGYTIPSGNPFKGTGRRGAIWAYGLRNPYRFSFDRRTGDLIIGDVGQDKWEEIDFAKHGTGAGVNYGWSIWEGDHRFKSGVAPHAVFPALEKSHSAAQVCAIIGGYVVRDHSVPALYGRYLYGDNCNPAINAVKLSSGHAQGDHPTGLTVDQTSSFGQDTSGHVYVMSLDGSVYRFAQ